MKLDTYSYILSQYTYLYKIKWELSYMRQKCLINPLTHYYTKDDGTNYHTVPNENVLNTHYEEPYSNE